MHTDIHASSGIQTQDSSVQVGEHGSLLRLRGRPVYWLHRETWIGLTLEEGDFLFRAPTPDLGPTQPFVVWLTAAPYPRVNRQGREANHSLQSSFRVKNALCYIRTPPLLVRCVVLHKYRSAFTSYLNPLLTDKFLLARTFRWDLYHESGEVIFFWRILRTSVRITHCVIKTLGTHSYSEAI
jgi:hypothetical protein